MYYLVISVLISACVIPAQFQFSRLSQFVPSSAHIDASGRISFPPPTPLTQELPLQPAIPSKQSPTLKSLLELKSPPPLPESFFASPKLEENPLRALGFLDLDIKDASNRDGRLIGLKNQGKVQISGDTTSAPILASPTTIKFTLDDVPEFLSPSISDSSSSASRESVESLDNSFQTSIEDKDSKLLASLREINEGQHIFILTSTERDEDLSTWRPSTPFSHASEHQDHGFLSDFQQSSSNFRPSFALPFLDQPQKDENLFTVVETRNPGDSSFLRSDTAHYLEKEPEVFPLNPTQVESENSAKAQKVTETQPETVTESQKNKNPILSKTPVPVPVLFDDNEESKERVTPPNKPLPTRKTFHFEQEFLSLLKKNTPKTQPEKDDSKFEPNPFWFSQQTVNNDGIWQLKGGNRAPSLDLDSQDSIVSQITIKNSLGGLFGTSLRGLATKSPKNEAALKILDDLEESEAGKGITVKSLAQGGLSVEPQTTGVTTTVKPIILRHNFSEPRLKLGGTSEHPTTHPRVTSHGPQIVPVGEVGEVPHGEGTSASTVPSLSATLKHGVQNLNVTAWVSGCPKLYGKAELHCAIEHDAISNTAMTLLWKKKSFTDGRPREHIMTENDLMVMEDERYSLEHRHGGHYVLTIKDFRPKDCGTYECEAKAADTRAASQLLLFTCH